MPTLFGRELSRGQIARHTGALDQLIGVTLSTFEDGPERGVRVLRFRAGGGFEAEVLVDRGMDLGGLSFCGVPIGWRSPTGFRSPWLHEHDGEGGLGWLRSFSGLVNTCGLDHIMGPAEESGEHYRYPYRRTVRHGLHGRIAYTPAHLLGYGVRWQGDKAVLAAEGEVRQATMFGENLVLHRRIEIEAGSTAITIADTVTSEGFRPTPHAMLYHVNMGWPLLDDGSRVVAPFLRRRATLFDDTKATIGPIEQAPPQTDFVEQVYEHEVRADEDGTGFAALVNPRLGLGGHAGVGVVVSWDTRTMPALYEWQNLQEGNYVLGLEPATMLPGSRDDWKKRGELPMLGHGEQRRYRLRLEAIAGAEAIAALDSRARTAGAG
jgi:hypothetical protein